MKNLLFVPAFLFSFSVHAQNYDCLQFGAKHYFINGNGYVRGMRLDSTRTTTGGDVVYSPYRTRRISNYLGAKTEQTLGASWLGKRVIKKADGTFLFDNLWSTVVVKTQARLGESWIFYSDATKYSYTATVTAERKMNVLGATDSAKTITIHAYKAGSADHTDPVDNFQIILSKNNGFVQVFDLYTFPYHRQEEKYFKQGSESGSYFIRHMDYYLDVVLDNLGACDPATANDHRPDVNNSIFRLFPFHNPTKREIYDYAIGDVFESKLISSGNPPDSYGGTNPDHETITLDTIKTMTSVANGNIYTGSSYSKKMTTDNSQNPPVISASYGMTPLTHFSDSTLLFATDVMPEEHNAGFLLQYFPHLLPGTLSCDSPASYIRAIDAHGTSFGGGLPSVNATTYSMGYGITGINMFNALTGAKNSMSYTYVLKNGAACGTFVGATVGVEAILHNNVNIKVLPNPANEQINISAGSLTGANTVVVVYDISGKCVFRSELNMNNELMIPTSLWNTGLYMVHIQNNEGIVRKEKVMIRH